MASVVGTIFLPAVIAGLVSHAVYKRYEPSVHAFLRNTIFLAAAFMAWAFYTQREIKIVSILGRTALFSVLQLLILCLSISVYRLFLHPLKRFPGPWLAKLTKLEGLYRASDGLFHDHMYGDIVRIGPNELSFRNASAIKRLHGKMNKGPYFETKVYQEGQGTSLNSLVDYDIHKTRRKTWDQAFSQKSLKSFGPLFNGLLDKLCDAIVGFEGLEINFADWCDYYAFDVMGGLAFNKDFGLLTGEGPRNYSSFIRSGIKMFYLVANIPWISPLVFLFPIPEELRRNTAKFTELGSKQYEERRAQGTEPNDIFSFLIAAKEAYGSTTTEEDLRADSPILFIAGSDTTSTSMAFLFYFLARDKRVYEKLQREVDAAWDGKSPLDAGMIGAETCPYLHGAIQETLRIVPPAPNGMQRAAPKNGLAIDGVYIPGGTLISVHAYSAQHDPRHFTNPLQFAPERWNDLERNPKWAHVPVAFIPFGLGSFVCIGRGLAMQELRLIAVRLIRMFDFALAPGFDHDKFWRDLRSWQAIFKPELPMIFKRRQAG
ncbi:hypothetical protein CLAIMM_00727 [Cladophialophora immunda]|nr:hypothetical protein CLAIMM_00727 [Cladophialophora immunda]